MNRSLIFIFILISGITSCKQLSEQDKTSIPFVYINGKLTGGNGKTLLLKIIRNENQQILDTIIINEKDEFVLEFQCEKTGFYYLNNEGGNSITIFCSPDDSLFISGNYYDFRKYSITGNTDSEQICILNDKTQEFLDRITGFAQIVRDSINSPDYQEIRLRIDKEYRESFDSLKHFSTSFIRNNSESLVSLLALSNQLGENFFVFHPVKDLEIFEEVDAALYEKYPEEESVIKLHQQIKKIKSSPSKSKKNLKPGDPVPGISLPDKDGNNIELASLRGMITLIRFTASWCNEYELMNQKMQQIYAQYKDMGFEIYQISLDASREKWLESLKNNNFKWKIVNDFKFWDGPAVDSFSVENIPFHCLADRNGKIISINQEMEALETELNNIFGK